MTTDGRKGDAARELIEELRALDSSGAALAAFDELKVRRVADRINELDADLANLLSNPHVDLQDPYYQMLPAYLQKAMLREKRCLVTYLKWRLDGIASLWWDSREHLATSSHATEVEAQYIRQYTNVMVEYMSTFEVPLDFRAFTSRPPCFPPSNIIEVRGLKAHSYVSPNTGRVVQLYAGKVCSVPVEDAEILVRQNVADYCA
jgi:GINS complex subunit 1